jgi:cytochrome c oxidase subunit II
MEQRIAVLVSVVLGLTLVALFAMVARSAGEAGSAEEIAIATARWRRTIFWGLVLVFVPVIAYSLTKTPYKSSSEPPAVVVSATGHQWAWEITPTAIPAGQPVEIRVTAADVNHGFAVYDSLGHIVTQTQAMPGFTNVIRHTFATPGTYRILCLEYCGLGHHTMAAQLVVNASGRSTP